MRFSFILLCLCTLPLVTSCLPPGQKLLKLEVSQGGEIILATLFDADDSSTASEIWDASGERPFATEVAATSLGQSEASPLKAELTGSVEIKITHTTNLQTSATLTGLTLVRSAPASDDWRLPAAEITRAKKAAGL